MSRITTEQKNIFLDFMTVNQEKLFGRFPSESGKNLKNKLWDELMNLLNDAGPPKKDVEQWKRVR